MLKLMRLEETAVFAIVDDNQFESEMDILGYVRMNYKEGLHYTKVFDDHKADWFKELSTVIREKEEELVKEVEYVKRTLNIENIVIQYLRGKAKETVKISVIRKLVLYLFDEIQKQCYLFNFRDYDQLNDIGIKVHLKSCKRVTVEGDSICINDSFSDIHCFNPDTAVDYRIAKMIKEFIAKEKK